MNMKAYEPNQTLIWAGGLFGVVPFWVSVFGIHWFGWESYTFTLYSAIILAFLSGVVWRNSLEETDRSIGGLSVALAVPALLWLMIFIGAFGQIAAATLGFLIIYGWERFTVWQGYPAGYRVLRTTLTTLVVVTHVLLLMLL